MNWCYEALQSQEEARLYKERTSCLEQKLEDKDFETEHKTEELEEKIKEANNVTNRRIETLRAEVKMVVVKIYTSQLDSSCCEEMKFDRF